MVVKIDKSTLPLDGQKVRFKLHPDIWKFGEYIESENLFWCSKEEFYDVWIVFEWELIFETIINENETISN